jgi:WD repeat and SOF domain-containing protein 1
MYFLFLMQTRCNSVCWNPREPMNFTAVRLKCQYFSCYTLDLSTLIMNEL